MVGFGLAGATPQAAWFIAAVVVAASLLQRVPSAVLNGLQKWRAASDRRRGHGRCRRRSTTVLVLCGRRRDRRHVRRRGRGDAREPRLALVAVARRRGIARRARAGRSAAPPRLPHYAFVASLGVILTFVVWRRSEFLFLNHYSTDYEIAIYSVAFSSVAALLLIPQAIVGVLAAGRGDAARRGRDGAHPPGLRAGDQAAPRAHAPDDRVRDRARPADAAASSTARTSAVPARSSCCC